ncbi:MAG: glycoside hydrolase family 31 protein [Breznakibacter sp.]
MKKILTYFIPLMAIVCLSSCGGGFTRNGNTVAFTVDGAKYRIELCNESMFRVRMAVSGKDFKPDDHWMVNKYDWGKVDYSVKESNGKLAISTSDLNIVVQKSPFHVAVYDKQNQLINQDAPVENAVGYHGEKPYVTKTLQQGEHFFGFGERMDFMDQLGKEIELNVGRGTGMPHEVGAYNTLKANYSPVPFFMSTKGYAIFFHNAYPSVWDMGKNHAETYCFSAVSGELDYYFIHGPAFTKLVGLYTELSGRTPLMPRSAMGLHVGTYSGGTWGHEHLTSQTYVVQLARKFRQMGIPVDILHLDSTWRIFGKVNGKGGTSFDWRQPGFPDPKAMFDELYGLNYAMVGLHIRPRIDNGDTKDLLTRGQRAGITYPEGDYPGDFPNYFDQKASDWWWENCMKPLADLGCMFVKTDEGSAFGHQGNELVDKTGPQGPEIRELHNLFPVAYAKTTYSQFADHNGTRGMNHTREGYAGIQRYPFIFAGDWPSEWQYFQPVIRAGLNIGMSGIGAWSHCMGGFEHVADPELYIRWCQFGMFSPVAMLFGMEHPNYKEPWSYGAQAQAIFTQYDKLRYSLQPYIYSAYYQMYAQGLPVMRAMVMMYPNDVNTYSIDDQYMFGDYIMVCPVTVKGAKTRVIYLPEGRWVDYWTGQQIEGSQHIQITTPIEKLPLFIKVGAVIPYQPDMQYMAEKRTDPLTIECYPGQDAVYELYEDDGISMKYQQGEFAVSKIVLSSANDETTVTIGAPQGSFQVDERTVVVKVRNIGAPSQVAVGGIAATSVTNVAVPGQWSYNVGQRTATVMLKSNGSEQKVVLR